jgi:YbgC/YbaW family acyl-CoA thioester hydrolase
MQRQDFRCFHRLRVRWAEVDIQKIVFNAHYLTYADCAMTEYWRALALPYEASMHALGGEIYLKKASVEYHASARLDDLLDIGMRCARVGTTSLLFECGVFAGDRLLVSVELVYVFADPATQTKRAVPPQLRAVIEHYEAGGEVVELRVGDWATLGRDAARLRTAVHAVAYNRLGLPVSTGRLLQPAPGEGRIGRMAVDRVVRGQRWGRMVLDALVQAARARGDALVTLHAQSSAEGFYRRAGFETEGAPYEEAGIAHVTMRKALP